MFKSLPWPKVLGWLQMFDQEHHQKILVVLNALECAFFEEVCAYFGGGTQLALQYGEYRWSKDIDFICAYGPGYNKLRKAINENGYDALFRITSALIFPREIKADQYGIRFAVIVGDTPIKFEIIAEGRVVLDAPQYFEWCPVPCLSFADACTEKLFANADRWPDSSVESRDLIDLAVLRQQSEIPVESYQKAEEVYPVSDPLKRALKHFQDSAEYRSRCFSALKIENRAHILDGIDLLARDCGLEATVRTSFEE